MNPYQAKNRLLKVGLLVDELDRQLWAAKFNPHDDAAAIVVMLADTWREANWEQLRKDAGTSEPSDVTREEVLKVYKRRAERAAVQQSAEVR